MKVRLATAEDEKAWDAYVLQHPDGLAYHQYAWKEAVEHAYSFSSIYLIAEDNCCFCGVLPLIDFKLPLLGRCLVSLPYCDVGGILADNSKISAELKDYAVNLIDDIGAKKLDLRNVSEIELLPVQRVQKVRMLLDLPDNSETLLTSLKAKLRSQVKKPMRDGLMATIGGGELATEFYQVFCENMRDLGSPVHSFNWIQSVLAAYGDNARVGIVRIADGTLAAGGIILLHGDKVSIPWASSLRRFNHLNPNMLLYWSFLSFAADNGFKIFDFGRSTPGEGTYKFKQQWGAKPQSLFWYNWSSDGMIVDSAQGETVPIPFDKRQLAANIWSRLPLRGANWLGPLIRRYISL